MVDHHDGIKRNNALQSIRSQTCHFGNSAQFFLTLPQVGFRNSQESNAITGSKRSPILAHTAELQSSVARPQGCAD
jgi:hypothetical protein